MGVHRHIILVILLLLGLSWTGTGAAQQIFQCRDEGGALTYQDRPCAGTGPATSHLTGSTSASAAENTNRHYLWEAEAGKGTLYLLGSIHFGNADMYPLPRVMTSLFRQADTLVVEADVVNVDPVASARLLAEKAMYQDGATLQQQLTPEMWQRLVRVCEELGAPVELFNQQKPWFASMSLTALALNRLGYDKARGIDAYFIELARGKKKLVELEGVEWQLSLFDQLTTAEQLMMLEQTLAEVGQGKAFFDEIFAAWRNGDTGGIEKLFDEGFSATAGGDRLRRLILTDRNRSMTERLHALAEQGGRYFVVIGAGHMTGEEGIVTLLRQHGYNIRQL